MESTTPPARPAVVWLPFAALLALILTSIACSSGNKDGDGDKVNKPTGQRVYDAYCGSCHGEKGRGDGASGTSLNPPPTDFVKGPWKHGRTEKDIARVTKEGIPPVMRPTTKLSDEELDEVAKYVLKLANAGQP